MQCNVYGKSITNSKQLLVIADLSPGLSQKELINNNGNLTEYSSKVLGSKRRKKRNPVVAMESNETNTNQYPQMNHHDYQLPYANDIQDGEIDINSNYTGFIEIIGTYTKDIIIIYNINSFIFLE